MSKDLNNINILIEEKTIRILAEVHTFKRQYTVALSDGQLIIFDNVTDPFGVQYRRLAEFPSERYKSEILGIALLNHVQRLDTAEKKNT